MTDEELTRKCRHTLLSQITTMLCVKLGEEKPAEREKKEKRKRKGKTKKLKTIR